MKPYFQDSRVTIYNKDCRSMEELGDESAQMVVTSPPFWGLRKYAGLPDLIWGGDEKCEHRWVDSSLPKSGGVGDYEVGRVGNAHARIASHEVKPSDVCSLCGAWKGSYGLEPTPEMYVQHTVEILREIRRVLRKDGVVFWNIGDSYAGSGKGQNADGSPGKSGKLQQSNKGTQVGGIPISRFDKWNSDTPGSIQVSHNTPKANYNGLKPKDLCLIPFRVAIAAQEHGWWVRSVIIWSKPNPMPESVADRPTESHEYILMLTKSKNYYWDAEAVREPSHPETWGADKDGSYFGQDTKNYVLAGVQSPSDIKKSIGAKARGTDRKGRRSNNPELGNRNFMPIQQEQRRGQDMFDNPAGRNIRSVWEFPTQPYPKAHFATFPEKLPEICIKAATPEVGCCSKCGKPWERIVERGNLVPDRPQNKPRGNKRGDGYVKNAMTPAGETQGHPNFHYETETLGWQPACKCNADKIPSLVLDPFLGSGTTLAVAKKLGRRAVGYELSEEYCKLALERNRQGALI